MRYTFCSLTLFLLLFPMCFGTVTADNLSSNIRWGCTGSNPPYDSTSLCPDQNLSYLNLHSFQQQLSDYTCGSAAIMTILSYYHYPVMYGNKDEFRIANELGTSPEYGTTPEMIIRYFKKLGWAVYWGNNGTIPLLREQINDSRPILVAWIDWGGHWTVVTGYDDRGTSDMSDDVLIFADSADRHDDRADGVTYFNARRFESMWFCVFPDHSLDNQRVWITPIPPSDISSQKEILEDEGTFKELLKAVFSLLPKWGG